MALSNIIECGGFYFIHNFDSGNLGHVERVPTELIAPCTNPKSGATETPDYEFNLWTRPDCAGTEFENGNRTWFYFGIQASEPQALVRLNLINLNKQGKMYNQGMAPVTRTLPGKPHWERIRDRPVHSMDDNTFTLSFKFRTAENVKATTFFAFTYPYSFAELQIALNSIDMRMLPLPPPQSSDDIYYARECLIYSLEGRRVDLLTITSHHGITSEREDRLKNLFPENKVRPHKFQNKKVIFISARVHPGETPSSFVFNGFLNLLLNRNDPIAIQLRKLYVFKMIPFLNPDGVARGHYRTDTRGVNLNRVYLNPSLTEHPTVYASRALIRYYHFGCEKEDSCEDIKILPTRSTPSLCESTDFIDKKNKRIQNQSFNKSADMYKKDKSKITSSSNRSITSVNKSSFTETKKEKAIGLSASNLAEQVYDMRLQETSSGPPPPGGNPLRPLRDALNNTISLLMGSTSSVACESSLRLKQSIESNARLRWCRECRRAVLKLEDNMPGISNMMPGYQDQHRDGPVTYHTIEEYREQQKLQLYHMERKKDHDSACDNGDSSYFCTNCFRKFIGTESDEETVCDASCNVTDGANGDARQESGNSDVTSNTCDVTCNTTDGASNTCDVSETPEYSAALPAAPKEEKPPRPAKKKAAPLPPHVMARSHYKEPDSGLFLYIDLHGHASKKGIFMYGNHFEDVDSSVECMLLPRVMSLNSLHFHFSSCNFTERNMYLKDRRDGMSREGSGRVAVLKATGLVRSYTLECNYNTGRLVNVLPPPAKDPPAAASQPPVTPPAPPKYNPHIFEDARNVRSRIPGIYEEIEPFEVGRSLGASILDLSGAHPNSRLPASEHRSLGAMRDWLRTHVRANTKPPTMSRLRAKASSPSRVPLYAPRARAKTTEERKENAYIGAKTDAEQKPKPAPFLQRSSHEIVNVNLKYTKRNEPPKTTSRPRYLADSEPKPRTLTIKRKNILAIRKPNSSKTQVGLAKAKPRRESEGARSAPKLGKRSYSRGGGARLAASSSDELRVWEEAAGGGGSVPDAAALKRRPFPNPSSSQLKKIRLKTAL